MTDDFFVKNILSIAEGFSDSSSDPARKVGAIITDKNLNVIAKGYNKFPSWVDVNKIETMSKDTKGMVIDHAEVSALKHLDTLDEKYHIQESYMFITCHPCKWCCESIISSKFNITKIFYKETVLSNTFRKRFCIHETNDILYNGNIELVKVKV